jgi:DNA-binding SARP family transcriptional activator
MSKKLELALLGNIEVRQDGVPVAGFRSSKAQALLAYLAVTGRPHLRPALAGLLWGEMPEAAARRNLTQALSNLRRVVGSYLEVSRQAIAFNRQASYWLDVELFLAQAGETAAEHASARADITRLEAAVALYSGDFLEGFYVRDAPAFEEWMLAQRARLRELALQGLHTLADHYARQGEAGQAKGIDFTTRLLALEPWREDAHRALMLLLAQSGQRGAALAQYETCRKALAEDLGVEPGPETHQLYQRIRDGEMGRRSEISPARPRQNLMEELMTLAAAEYPEANYDFLDHAIYTTLLTAEDRQQYLLLLGFARSLQSENPVYESLYRHLLHLYVLNGSRLDLLETIDRRLRGLAKGQGAVLLISGISGIGKTSLVMAFEERADELGAALIPVRSFEQERSPYALWQDVARSVASTIRVPIETLSAPIGNGNEALSSQQLKRSLAEWLNRCAAAQSLVILLDDLHWASADSLEVLNYVTDQAVQVPLLFIATYRSEKTQSRRPLDDFIPKLRRNRQLDLIHLHPLSRDDIDRLVTAYHGPCSLQLAEYLYERAEGHPLFTVELLNDLIAEDSLSQDRDGFWLPPEQSVPVPTFLKQLITQRVSRLGEQVEQLLSVGAVAGEIWPLKIVERVLEMPEHELLEALETALRAAIITIEDDQAEVYRFSHGLIQQVLYTGQLARRRKRLHERIAAQLEEQQAENIHAIAYHFHEAENWAKAVNYYIAAGEQAVQRFASYSALQQYQKALNAAQRAGNDLAPAVLLDIFERLGRTHRVLEQRKEAEIVYSRMRDVAQSSGDLVSEGHALANLAYVRINQYQIDLAERTAYEALKIGEQSGDVRLLAHTHACLGALLVYRSQLEQVTYHLDQALHHAETLDDFATESEIHRWRSYVAIWKGEYQEAETCARLALKQARKVTDPLAIMGSYQNLSYAQIESGEYRRAYQNIRAVLEAGEISEIHHHNLPRLLNLTGYLHLELGGAQEALVWDKKALEASWITQAQGNYEMRRYSLLNIATDYLHLGQLEQAQDTVAQFEAIKEAAEYARFRYFNRYLLLMSEMHLEQNAFELALELAQEARNLAASNGIPKNIAKSHWFEGQALAGMVRFDEALEHLEKGIAIVDGIQHGSLRWKIRLSLAEVRQKAGKSPATVLRQARELIDRTLDSLLGSPLQGILLASHWVKRMEELEQSSSPVKPTYCN